MEQKKKKENGIMIRVIDGIKTVGFAVGRIIRFIISPIVPMRRKIKIGYPRGG